MQSICGLMSAPSLLVWTCTKLVIALLGLLGCSYSYISMQCVGGCPAFVLGVHIFRLATMTWCAAMRIQWMNLE